MAARVVCLSRTRAAGGEEIGALVAERLGLRYVDEQVIEQAARLAQVDAALVAAAEQRQPLLRRVTEKLAAARDLLGPAALGVGVPLLPGAGAAGAHPVSTDDLRALIQAAIHQIAGEGGAVIVAHAASMVLGRRPDVLRVLVTGSPEVRAQRLAAAAALAAPAAAAEIAASDRDRQDYFHRFHGLAAEQPTHYDLVLNTDGLAPAEAAAVIVAAAGGAG